MSDIRERLKDISEIPPLPDSVVAVLNAMRDPSVSAKDITDMISCDVAISSKLLKIANSAYYGFRGNISSVTHAIVMLGFGSVKNLILSLSVQGLLGAVKDSEGFSVKDFWKHCVGVAVASRVIAGRLGQKNSEEFFTQGLLHDIGKLVMYKLEPALFLEIVRMAKAKELSFVDAEKQLVDEGRIDLPHTSLGYELFTVWKMPKSLVESAGFHHDKDLSKTRRHILIVALANNLIKQMKIGESGDNNIVESGFSDLCELAEISPPMIEMIKGNITEGLEKAKVFLEFLEGE